MTKWVYSFGGGQAEGNAGMKELLGDKPYRELNTPRALSLRPVFVG